MLALETSLDGIDNNPPKVTTPADNGDDSSKILWHILSPGITLCQQLTLNGNKDS